MSKSAAESLTLFELSPAMLWQSDEQGRCVFLNQAQREFWGIESNLDNFEWASTLLEDDREQVFGPFQEGMERQEQFACEGRYRRADGAVRVLRTKATPYFEKSAFMGMIGVNEDVTDLREAQASLNDRNKELSASLSLATAATKRFELASQISGIAMSEHDDDLRYTWGHNLPGEFLGLTPEEFIGGEVGCQVQKILKSVLVTGEAAELEINFLMDGNRRWWELQASRASTEGEGNRVIACALDVTTWKLNQSKLEVLSRELSHRAKNFHSLAQALLQQSARSAKVDPSFVSLFSERLMTLSRAQDALFESSNDRVSVRAIVDRNLGHLSRVNASGDDATILGVSSTYLALALHELGTNALKYGALSADDGTVTLQWRKDTKGVVHVVWEERSSAPVREQKKEGFGTALITRIFAASTNGQAVREFTPEGFRWSAQIPTAPELVTTP